MRSANQKFRTDVASNIVTKAGLTPVHTIDILHDTADASFPAVAQAIQHQEQSPDRLHYAASWIGLTNKFPQMLVFHCDPKGPDSLYKLKAFGDINKIRKQLDDAGISQRVLIPNKDSVDIMIHDPDRHMRKNIGAFAKKIKVGNVMESVGEGVFIGGGDAASSRKAYRDIINKYETQASVTPPPQPQEQQNAPQQQAQSPV